MGTPDPFIPELVPARMLNEHVYCPRLAYLEWVDRRFEDNSETTEGTWIHRRVDAERGAPPEPAEVHDDAPRTTTSLTLSSEKLGVIAKVDLLELHGGKVVPVEYKRGRPRSKEQPLWEPELVQLCAQVLLLREAGYSVDGAEVYFDETRTRHRITIDQSVIKRTLRAIAELRANAAAGQPPPPLVDSPKCPRCSLVGLCLPDEVNALRERGQLPPRRLVAGDPAATPLYATTPGGRLAKRHGRLTLLEEGREVASRRLIDVSHIGVFGNVDVSSALLRTCFEEGIQVLWFTSGGWLSGVGSGMSAKNINLRMRQHRAAAIGAPELASAFIAGKIRNARTLLRRHGGKRNARVLRQLLNLAKAAEAERRLTSLLGLEGTAARLYFECFGDLLRPTVTVGGFDFKQRNRRPPRDRVNALLSFFYALLVKDTTIAALAAGFDPYLGFYHRPRFGRPALALDLAEEFRPLVADSAVLMAVNNGEIQADDFIERAGAVALTAAGRRRAIATYERRMAAELRHPLFGYRASYRRTLEIQARLLAAVLEGDVAAYRPLTTR